MPISQFNINVASPPFGAQVKWRGLQPTTLDEPVNTLVGRLHEHGELSCIHFLSQCSPLNKRCLVSLLRKVKDATPWETDFWTIELMFTNMPDVPDPAIEAKITIHSTWAAYLDAQTIS